MPDWSKPIILLLLLLCGALALRSQLSARRARHLETKHRALAEDIGLMQAALVPEIPPRLGALTISAAYRPADGPAAGGDFYDAFTLGDGRVVIILGDVSGHGRAALAHAARMRYTVRAYAEAGLAPREVLKLAGNAVARSADGLYTTVLVAVDDPRAGSLTYASAGHPPPLFPGPSAHHPLTICASHPLGWGMPSGRRETTVPFPGGRRACIFSDGLVEARGERDLLGRDRLAQMLTELGPDASAAALLESVRGYAAEIRDDMAACIIEAADASRSVSHDIWLETLELDSDQLQLGQGQRFLAACGLRNEEIQRALFRVQATLSGHETAVLTVTRPEAAWSVSRPVNRRGLVRAA